MAVMKAFVVFSLPFVLAETAFGVTSLITGGFSIPPLTGPGAAADLAVLFVGLMTEALGPRKLPHPTEKLGSDSAMKNPDFIEARGRAH